MKFIIELFLTHTYKLSSNMFSLDRFEQNCLNTHFLVFLLMRSFKHHSLMLGCQFLWIESLNDRKLYEFKRTSLYITLLSLPISWSMVPQLYRRTIFSGFASFSSLGVSMRLRLAVSGNNH